MVNHGSANNGRKRSDVPGVMRLSLNQRKAVRNREIQTCQPCRSRKTRCDQAKPRCRKCLVNNRDCSYLTRDPETCEVSETPEGPSNVAGAEQSAVPQERRPQRPDDIIHLNQLGHLKASNNGPYRYYSSSSWMTATENAVAWTSRSEDNSSVEGMGSSRLLSPNGLAPKPVDLPAGDLHGFLQDHEVDYLILWYSSHCHFWHPIFDIQEITTNLHMSRGRRDPTPAFLAQVAAICYSAACSIGASGDLNLPRLVPTSTWKRRAEEFLNLAGYPFRPSLDTVRAAYLLATPSSAEETSHFDPGPVCVLLRAAQRLGLHREPSSFHLPRRDADMRRVIWWSIHALEVSYAVSHALPPLLHPTTFDAKLIDIENRRDCRLMNTIARVTVVMSRTLYEIYGVRQPTYSGIRELDEQATETRAREVAESQPFSSQTTALDRFISLSQRMCCSKMIYILHQPYLRSPQWPRDSRPKALSACQEYIGDFLTCLTDPALTPYRWVLDHFNIIHACAILLQDLIQNPSSAESNEIRVTAEICFSTLSANLNPNLAILETLRSKAWSANEWPMNERQPLVTGVDASLSDWDPLFASFVWEDLFM